MPDVPILSPAKAWALSCGGRSPTEIVTRAKELVQVVDCSVWELGKLLTEILAGQLYLYLTPQYASFDDFVEAELGFTGRKGRFYAQIFQSFFACQLGPEEVSRLGSAKCRLLARVITPENYEGWIEKAEVSTYRQLEAEIKAERPRGTVLGSIQIPYTDEEVFEIWEAAREIASRMTGTETAASALEAMAAEFLGTYGDTGSHDQDQASQESLAEYEILSRDNWRCVACGKRVTLQVHHVEYRSRRPDLIDDPDNKATTCLECHDLITSEKAELIKVNGKWVLKKKK